MWQRVSHRFGGFLFPSTAEIVLHQVKEALFTGFFLRFRAMDKLSYEVLYQHIKPNNQNNRQEENKQKNISDSIYELLHWTAMTIRAYVLYFTSKLKAIPRIGDLWHKPVSTGMSSPCNPKVNFTIYDLYNVIIKIITGTAGTGRAMVELSQTIQKIISCSVKFKEIFF